MPVIKATPDVTSDLDETMRFTADKIIKTIEEEHLKTKMSEQTAKDPVIISLNAYNLTMHYVSALMKQVIGQCLDMQANYEQEEQSKK